MGHVGEVIHVDEQDVAYEIEVENDGEFVVSPELQEGVDAPYYHHQETDIPSTSEQVYDYVPVHGDRLIDEHGFEYIFDEPTQSYQQMFAQQTPQEPPKLHANIIEEEVEEVEGVIEEEQSQPGPSTSSNNVYMIKRGGKRKYPEKMPGKLELYNPISFTTSFSESMKTIKGNNTNMKKLVKYSQINTMNPDEVEQVVESGQIMSKLQNEITKLRKDNEKLKRENEEVHRKLMAVTGKHVEARQNNHDSNMTRRELQRHLNSLRQTRKDLINTTTWE